MQAPRPKKKIIFVVFHMAKPERTLVLFKHTASTYLLEKAEPTQSHKRSMQCILWCQERVFWALFSGRVGLWRYHVHTVFSVLLGDLASEVARSPSLLCNCCSPLIFSTITGKKSSKKHLNSSTVPFNHLVPCRIMNLSQFHG